MLKNTFLKILLYPIFLLYKSGVFFRNLFYDIGLLPKKSLPIPVISVGNLTVGGTGKTPFTIRLTQQLLEEGFAQPCILSRGYRREDESSILEVNENSDFMDCGDEPLLMKKALKNSASVFVGGKRYKTGIQALSQNSHDCFILDDGFQHRQLKRNVDIVLIDSTNPFGNRKLTPYGYLREELTGLKRADIIVLTRSKYLKDKTALLGALLSYGKKDVPVFEADMEIHSFLDPFTNETLTVNQLKGKKALAFAAIGNPLAFKADLITAGLDVPRAFAIQDHKVPTPSQLKKMNDIAIKENVEYIITTEKDWIKLKNEDVLSAFSNLLICRAEIKIHQMESLINTLKEKLNDEKSA